MEIISNSARDTINIGKAMANNLRAGDIICLFGELGSGKTVLAKGIAQGLGIEGRKVVSPSYVLIRQHSKGKIPLYHFDLYRLKTPDDILALGYEEYLNDEAVSVIEWADRLSYLMPKEFLKVELFVKADSKRKLKFNAVGRRYKELLRSISEDIRR